MIKIMEPKEQERIAKRKSRISSKRHMICISSSNDGHKSIGLSFSQTTAKQ